MTVEINDKMVRLLIIDTSIIYSSIYDEIYVPAHEEDLIIEKYESKYIIVKV